MTRGEFLTSFVIFGVLFVFALLGAYKQRERNDLIKACEVELPRNQKCVLIAVPETESSHE